MPILIDYDMIRPMHMKYAGFAVAGLLSAGVCGLGCDSNHESSPTTQISSTGTGSSTSAAGAGIGTGDGIGSGFGTINSESGVSGTKFDSAQSAPATPKTEKAESTEHK